MRISGSSLDKIKTIVHMLVGNYLFKVMQDIIYPG